MEFAGLLDHFTDIALIFTDKLLVFIHLQIVYLLLKVVHSLYIFPQFCLKQFGAAFTRQGGLALLENLLFLSLDAVLNDIE